MNEVSSECKVSEIGFSFATLKPAESVDSLDGVCDREGTADEHLDDPAEFKFSSGISSLVTRGLESRDVFGVPECDRCLEPSRVFGVFAGLDDDFEELRRRDGSLKGGGGVKLSKYFSQKLRSPFNARSADHLASGYDTARRHTVPS